MAEARKGKIARLPIDIRDAVNQRLDDGVPGPAICAWLNGQDRVRDIMAAQFGGEKVSPQNLSEWRKGGFLDWKADQSRSENIRRLSEIAVRVVSASEGSIAEGAAAIAAGKLLNALESADAGDLSDMVGALTSLRMAEIAAVRANTDKTRLDIQAKTLDLNLQKFRRETAELFLRWYDDETAKRIVAGNETKQVKMDELVKLMWGAAPNAQSSK